MNQTPDGLEETIKERFLKEITTSIQSWIDEFVTRAITKERELAYQEGFDKGYETASGERRH